MNHTILTLQFSSRFYWREDSKFTDAACEVVRAATDFGLSEEDVRNAFRQASSELPFSMFKLNSIPKEDTKCDQYYKLCHFI